MSRKQLPDPPRRHSLPVPSILPTVAIGGQSRSFPEGTDTFQRALEDLYISDTTQPYVHYRHDGLKQIQEGDEEEYSSEDSSDLEHGETRSNGLRDVSTPSFLAPARVDRRRHSMPTVLLSQATDKDLEKYPLLKAAKQKSSKTVVKERANYSKEYFIKHGHWPAASKPHRHVTDDNAKASPRRTNTNSVSPTRKHRVSKT